MLQVLVIDKDEQHALSLVKAVLPADSKIRICLDWREGLQILRRLGRQLDLVLVCSNGSSEQQVHQLRALKNACSPGMGPVPPRFVCILPNYKGPEVELLIEEQGIRVAYE
jgi:hypothetical protein